MVDEIIFSWLVRVLVMMGRYFYVGRFVCDALHLWSIRLWDVSCVARSMCGTFVCGTFFVENSCVGPSFEEHLYVGPSLWNIRVGDLPCGTFVCGTFFVKHSCVRPSLWNICMWDVRLLYVLYLGQFICGMFFVCSRLFVFRMLCVCNVSLEGISCLGCFVCATFC